MQSPAAHYFMQPHIMPKHFVPVFDPERPRAEQEEDASLQKHRAFDKMSQPYTLFETNRDRGGRDSGAQVPKMTPSGTMIQNEKGLWVKAPQQVSLIAKVQG